MNLKANLTFSLIYYFLKNFFQMDFSSPSHKKATWLGDFFRRLWWKRKVWDFIK